MSKRIAVIGTGISGASCAARLKHTFNFNVKLFEKSRGVGGRMATRRGTRANGEVFQCDHGAQYFTARSTAFQKQVEEFLTAGVVDEWRDTPKVYDGVKGLWTDSASGTTRWYGRPTMTAPVKHLLAHNEVELNSTICEIVKNADGQWAVCSKEEGWLDDTFDAVICAMPAPQAAELVGPHSAQLARIADSATMKAAWALILQFETPLDLPFDSAFINGGPLSWIARDSAKPGRESPVDTWLLHATANWSHDHIHSSVAEVATKLVDALCSLTPPPGSARISPPQEWIAHRWLYATTHPNLNVHSAWDEDARLGMCGDWLDEGKVEGAWLSGRHLGDSVGGTLLGASASKL